MALDVGEVKTTLTADISDLEAKFAQAHLDLEKLAAGATTSMHGQSKAAEDNLTDLASKFLKTGGAMAVALTPIGLGLIAIAEQAAKTAISFETAFAGIKKTISATPEQFVVIRDNLRDLAKEIPLPFEALAAIGEQGGALGIAQEGISTFVKVVAQMATSTNLTTTATAEAFGTLGNTLRIKAGEFENLGSAIVALGNKGASTEVQIVSMMTRLSGAGSALNLTGADIAAIAAAMADVGIKAEMGGTAMSKMMIAMAQGVHQGVEGVETFAKISQMSAEQFIKAFKDDPAAAIAAFVAGLGRIKTSGGDLFATMDELDIKETRVRETFLRLAGAGDKMTESLQLSRTSWTENTALAQEAGKRYETTASQLTIFNNRVRDVGETFGAAFLPMINRVLTGLIPFIEKLGVMAQWFADLPSGVQQFIGVMVVLGTVIGPVVLAIGAVIAVLGAAAAPIAIVGGAILGLASIATVLWMNWDTLKQKIIDLWTAMKTKVLQITADLVNGIKDWFEAKLDAVLAPVKRLTTGVEAAFAFLKDRLVGHSIVPEMVDDIDAEFERMTSNLDSTGSAVERTLPDHFQRMRYATGNTFKGMTTGMSKDLQDFVGGSDAQLKEFVNAASFTWGNIRSQFASSVANMIVDGAKFGDFVKQMYKTILAAAINYFIQAAAEHLLGQLMMRTEETATAAVHATTEAAKTEATVAGETARMAVTVATNKVALAAVTAAIVGVGAMGNAALALVEILVTAVAAAMYAMASAVAFIPIIGQAAAGGLITGATLLEFGGTAAVVAGTAALNTALGGAIVASTTALATPFAEGGIVSQPTLALIGERGREAVVPLDGMQGGLKQQTIVVELDGRQITRYVMNDLVGFLRLRGVPA